MFGRDCCCRLCGPPAALKVQRVLERRAMGLRVKLMTSGLALALAVASVGGAQAQSITQALTIAYEHAPDLQAALLSAKAAAEGVAQAKAGMRPQISASVSGGHSWSLVGGSL